MEQNKEDFCQWTEAIFPAIKALADTRCEHTTPAHQAARHTASGHIPACLQAINALYAGHRFRQYLKSYNELFGDDSLYAQLEELDQLITAYKPKKTELILKDRKWTEITGLASRIYESASRWLLAEA